MRSLIETRRAGCAAVRSAIVAMVLLAPAAAVADEALAPVPQTPLREDAPPFGPAAAAEVGIGAVYPSFGSPVMNLLGRVGVSFAGGSNSLPALRDVTLSVGGETGVALGVGNGSPTYGYLLRIPARGFVEFIISKVLDYRTHKYMNLHLGGSLGKDFTLASQCAGGSCNYFPASLYLGFGARVGISFSQSLRSAVGVFMRWDNDVASPCSGGAAPCNAYIQTYTWNLGWTLF